MKANPQLILADGTTLNDSSCGYFEHELHCWVRHMDLTGAFMLFSDSAKTRIIHSLYMNTEETYDDFTEVILIRKMEDCIEVRLGGGHKRAA